MPPAKKGDPLPQAQIDLIKKWIEEGADFGTWTGAAAKEAEKPTEKASDKGGDAKPKDKGEAKPTGKGSLSLSDEGLTPLPSDTLDALRATFSVEPYAAGSALLRVSSFGREGRIDDAALRSLEAAKQHVAELVLARTHVTDAGMQTVAEMPRLSHLDLRGVKITDEGAKSLATAKRLRSINLVGSAVGDSGLAALSQCASLEQVYVCDTPVTATAVVAMQRAIPSVRITFVADLPEPMADAEQGAARARRR